MADSPGPARNDGAPLRVALLGLGTVGKAVAERLIDAEWRAAVTARGANPPELVAVGVREPGRKRALTLPASIRQTADLDELVADPGIDVVVELIGGLEPAAQLVQRAFEAGKHVVTANKKLLASFGPTLETAARAAGVVLRFEAAVAGGIPVLAPLVLDLAGNRISGVRGIVNGTTNFILTAMARDGRTYADVLSEAQGRGYAEADPSADVEGFDAADKLAILSRLAFGAWPEVGQLRRAGPDTEGDATAGITAIQPLELRYAAELGLAIKLVGDASLWGDAVMASVMPVAVRASSPIGSTDGVTNVVEITAAPVGVVTFQGPGAGGGATSSAVLADLLALARGAGSTWGQLPEPTRTLRIIDPLEIPRAWFLVAADAVGDGVANRVQDIALASTGDAVVTQPMGLDELRHRLEDRGIRANLYPLLPES